MASRPFYHALFLAGLIAMTLQAAGQSAPTPAAEAIEVQDLPALNPNEVGFLDGAHGGLGLDLWRGSGPAVIAKGLALLPEQPAWRSLRGLQRRLLASVASLPAALPPGEPVIALRAGKLAAMGKYADALTLLRLVPGPSVTPLLRRLRIDDALASGDIAAACEQEPAVRAAQSGDNYAIELQVLCQFAAGHGGDAGLGVDLLREQKLKDPLFFAAAEALAGFPPARLEPVKELTPMDLAIASLAKLPLPETVAATVPAGQLPMLAAATGAPPELRLLAAERGLALGTVSGDQLRGLYEAAPLGAAELATAGGETGRTAKSRSILYRAAQQQPIAVVRAELIQRGLAADPIGGTLLYGPLLADLPCGPDLIAYAPWVIRALLAGGRIDAARPWLALMRDEGLLNAGGGALFAALRPLARLAGDGAPLTSDDLTAWRLARNEPPGDATRHSLLLLCLLSALGDPPPEPEWLALLDGPAVINGKVTRSALAVGLANAVAAGRKGEVVLYVLLALGEQRDVEPAEFARLIAALRAVGLEGDARALALDLALAFGI